MTFEEKFIELVSPYFELSEPDDGESGATVDSYYALDEKKEHLIAGLKKLAEGDSSSIDDLISFFNETDNHPFLICHHPRQIAKIIAIASNITTETWGLEIPENTTDAPVSINVLPGAGNIDQVFSATGEPLPFYFYNSSDDTNSVAFVDFRYPVTFQALTTPPEWGLPGKDLIEAWSVILLLSKLDEIENCVAVISAETDSEKSIAHLKYHLVLSGNRLTLPVPLPEDNFISNIQSELTQSPNYIQFDEPFTMLSEINSCKSVLDTYLSTYHVLENYMIRSKVASVLSNTAGRSFQRVRDFKRLGQQTGDSEISHLSRLIEQCWDIEIGTKKLSDSLTDHFATLLSDSAWDEVVFDQFLIELGVLSSNGKQISFLSGFNTDESLKPNFVKLIYNIRCSIVHNKATEFHLSNEGLRRVPLRQSIITKFCLPVMQRIAFGLPSSVSNGNPIYYDRRELLFY